MWVVVQWIMGRLRAEVSFRGVRGEAEEQRSGARYGGIRKVEKGEMR